MKHKYVLRNSLYLDEELQDYFNSMSKKGWRLDFIGYYYRFSKDEHVYKYQIDYTPVSKEYQELLKEMGYHKVKNALYDFRVLENEDEDAPDLNTEFIFDKNNKIKQFKKIRYFIYPILSYFLFGIGKLLMIDFFEIGFPIVYYEGFTKYFIVLMIFTVAIGILLSSILNLSILYALKYDKSLRILKKLNGIKDYLIFAISIIYLIGIIVTSLLSANAFYMMFIPVIIIGILQKLSPTFNTRQMRYLFSVILALSFFINANQSKNQYETLEQIDDIYESETVKTKTIDYVKELKGQEIVYYERNITIKKDLYKKGIFKFIVILTDYETRENEAYIDFLNDDHTYQFDTNKIHYKKYDQAIKSFKKKGNTYTNKDYQIVVTKNKIKTTYIGTR